MAQSLVVKMDPIVRKLESNLSQFKQALQDDDLVSAQQLLRAISQTSDYLADDVSETQERPLGLIAPSRIGSRFQPHRSPGHRI